MSRLALLLLILGLLAIPNRTQAAVSVVARALPGGAVLNSQANVPGEAGYIGVTFAAPEPTVGVIRISSGKGQLLWSHALPFTGRLRESNIHPGIVIGSGVDTSSARSEVFAYSAAKGLVKSAIEGHPHGIVLGDEGVRFHTDGFSILRRDTKHQGSITYLDVTPYRWATRGYVPASDYRRPLLAASAYPRPNAVIKTRANDTILLTLEVAATEAARENGLMNRATLDLDSGMVFVWNQPVRESFWMENTFVPLSIAFLNSDGTIQEIQDMAPLTADLHTPAQDYQYAIEANQGFFSDAGIAVGDHVQLDLAS